MSAAIGKNIKRVLYGTIPYAFLRIFHPGSSKLPYYKFLKDHEYSRYVYDFAREYLEKDIPVYTNKEKELPYVIHSERKLYFPRTYSDSKVRNTYRALLIEQDTRHPHHYVESLNEFENKTLLDIGAAEGFTSLEAIEKVKYVYLFECDPGWLEALTATFEPWKEKVQIIRKYIGKRTQGDTLTLDDFMKDKPRNDLFLKMDIEGAECDALEGSKELFATASRMDFAICTYHRKNDVKRISAFLNRFGCAYTPRPGYMYVKHRLRTAVVRGNI